MKTPWDRKAPAGRDQKAPAGRRVSTTTAATDTESGNDGAGAEQALFALDAMFRRGLLPEAEYRRRRAEIEDGVVNPGDASQ